MKFNHEIGKHIAIDDALIYYEELGKKEGPVLLLLHGGMNTLEVFNNFTEALPEDFGYRVIAIDSRGHGKSTLGTKPLSYQLLQEEVEKVLAHLGVSELSILGYSNGGTVAYRLAAFSDLNITRLVTLGAPWHNKYLEPMFDAIEATTVEQWKEASPKDYQAYQRLNPEPDIETAVKQAIRLGCDTSSQSRPNEAVKNIKTKVLVIKGENDPFAPDESVAEFCALVPQAQVIQIPGGGHDVVVTHPKAVIDAMLPFLKSRQSTI